MLHLFSSVLCCQNNLVKVRGSLTPLTALKYNFEWATTYEADLARVAYRKRRSVLRSNLPTCFQNQARPVSDKSTTDRDLMQYTPSPLSLSPEGILCFFEVGLSWHQTRIGNS